MTVDERYDELRRAPFWQVQAVFDPDGEGGDFAYTIGLHERGLPELHLWARPTLGEDPGHDWMFSIRDRTEVLNDLAAKLVVGEICVGSEVVDTFDGGLATVRFRVDPPGDREELEAFGIAPGAVVLPVRWSLHRLPEGAPTAVPVLMRRLLEPEVRRLRAAATRPTLSPRGWELPEGSAVDFSKDQPFGPFTPLVRARAAQLWQADDETIREALEIALAVEAADGLGRHLPLAVAAARPVGRRAALEQLHDEVHELVWWLTDRPAVQRRWRAIVEGVVPEDTCRTTRERKRAQTNCAWLLHSLALGCLSVDALADVAEKSLLLAGRGPWVLAFDGATGPDWHAEGLVQEAVRRLLQPLSLDQLADVARRHVVNRVASAHDERGYAHVTVRLSAWSWVGPGACAWDQAIADLPGWTATTARTDLDPLHEWASCVTAAITHRDRLSEDEVRTFVAPFADLLPDLAMLLREDA